MVSLAGNPSPLRMAYVYCLGVLWPGASLYLRSTTLGLYLRMVALMYTTTGHLIGNPGRPTDAGVQRHGEPGWSNYYHYYYQGPFHTVRMLPAAKNRNLNRMPEGHGPCSTQ